MILASASPRRQDFLRILRVPFEAVPTEIDESLLQGESPFEAATRLAREKARYAATEAPVGTLVIAADTLVVLDGKALGKPADGAEAREMLRALSGRRHEVVTAISLLRDGVEATGREITEVDFAELTEDEIERYAATGEPDGKSGAYAMQGIGALLVERISGSPSNVVGLPVRLLGLLARRLGVDLLGV